MAGARAPLITVTSPSSITAIQDETRWVLEEALSGLTHDEIDDLIDRLRRVIGDLGGHVGWSRALTRVPRAPRSPLE